jgi:hypothetical protein
MRVVFSDAVHARPATENILSFPYLRHALQQDAAIVRQQYRSWRVKREDPLVFLVYRSVSFVWLSQTDRIDQMNQINPRISLVPPVSLDDAGVRSQAVCLLESMDSFAYCLLLHTVLF